MPESEQIRFSRNGEFLALSGVDGRLKIWETATSTLKQEFTPASHLTAGCTCLEWSPSVKSGNKKKKKKVLEGEVVVMGTNIGSILFYDVTKAQLLSQTKEAHTGKVTGLSWSSVTLNLYSCGADGFLLEWDPSTANHISRWKGCNKSLSALSVFNNNLLACGDGITMWDLKTKTLISSFTGHPGPVTRIDAIPSSDYFISMGDADRFLRIWTIGEKNSIVTLVVPEIPHNYHISAHEDGEVSVSVVTQKGQVHFFEKKLNGHIRKPLAPTRTLEIIDNSSGETVPVLTCCLQEKAAVAAYGSWTKVRFEKFDTGTIEKLTTIKRDYATSKRKSEKFKSSNEVQLTEVEKDVKHLQPGTETTAVLATTAKKRKKSEPSPPDGELPMEDRLTNLTLQSAAGPAGIRGNNLGHLLSQGLHSKDTRILHSVLSRWDDEVITNTVRSLPVQLVVTLLTEIKVMLAGKGQTNNTILKWLKSILQIHSSYLMCCPSADELLGPFMSLLHSREVLYPQLCQLRGKLELIKGNIEAKQHKSEPINEALLVFNDDSSDEAVEDEEALMAESEDFLTSDELGESDSGESDQDEVDSDSNKTTESGTDSEDDNEVKTNAKSTKTKNLSKSIQNHFEKSKGKPMEEDSGPESMDEDA